ncbi:MAG: hypothetical protein Q9206_001202 [Seirophora lacunosa]
MYEDPEQNDEENPFQQRRYIEAVTGAPFEVLLTLRPGFEFGTCDAVRVEFCFDNMSPVYFVDIKREDAAVETGVREQGQLTFAKLEIKEKSDLGIPPDTLADLGAIEVWYQRIWYGATRRCNLPRYDSRISEVSEKTLKGRSIEHSIELVTLSPKARLAELERNQPNVKPERARVESGVKRERDDKEDQAPRKRNRRIETIDLTDD